MNYKEFSPSPNLSTYINCYWVITTAPKELVSDIVMPDGCMELIFNPYANAGRLLDNNNLVKNPEIEMIGQLTKSYRVVVAGKCFILGIKFFPHTAKVIFSTHKGELNNLNVDFSILANKAFLILKYQLLDLIAEGKIDKAIFIIEDYLIRQIQLLKSDLRKEVLDYAVNRIIYNSENNIIPLIIKKSGVSLRYLERIFSEDVGISAKFFTRVMRFQKSFSFLSQKNTSLTTISNKCGYHDQSHFIRDFKAFSGLSPGQYQISEHKLNDQLLIESNIGYLYNSKNYGASY